MVHRPFVKTILTTRDYGQNGQGGQSFVALAVRWLSGQQLELGNSSPVNGQVKLSLLACCVAVQQSGGHAGQQPG